MKHTLFFAILLLTTTTACSNCLNLEGKYTTSGGSEQMTHLDLLKNNTFILKHQTWKPGAYENKKTTHAEGTWSCLKNQITLMTSKFIYNAEYLAIGKNPLAINEKTMVIHFKPDNKNINHYLNNEIFYPASSLSD